MNKYLFHMKQLSLVLIAAMLILAGCAGSYYHAGNRNYNQKDRSQRRDGVKGYCRAAAQGIVGDVTRDSGFQDFPRL